ncbi:MAG: GIY-YIG nuclease family protein, partial [Polaribacter sp.]
MKYFVYILFSEHLNRFYIGFTSDISARIIRHNQKSNGFTGRAKDWILV